MDFNFFKFFFVSCIFNCVFLNINLNHTVAWCREVQNSTSHNHYQEVGVPFITNYTSKDFNTYSQNSVVIQDRRGVMYFGNVGGILEFDGSFWRLIKIPEARGVRSLAIGKDGIVYVGVIGDFGFLASNSNGKMKYISLRNKIPKRYRPFDNVEYVISNNQGIFFITSNYIFRYTKNKVDTIRLDNFTISHAISIGEQLFILGKSENTNNLYYVDGSQISRHPLPSYLVNQNVRTILPYPQGRYLVTTYSGNFHICNKSLLMKYPEIKELPPEICTNLDTDIGDYLEHNGLNSGVRTHDNHYVFGTRLGGIVIMNQDGRLIRVVNKNRGLLDNYVNCVFVDRDNNIWVALNKGAAYIESNSPLSVYNAQTGLDTFILDFMRFNGRLYVSSFNGVHILSEYSLRPVNDKIGFLPVDRFPLQVTFSMMKIRERLYLFPEAPNTGRTMASLYEIQGHKAVRIMDQVPYVMSFCRSKRFPNHLFLGLARLGFGALEFDPTTGKIMKFHFNTGNFAKLKETVQFLHADSQGDLWLAAQSGIRQVHFTGKSIEEFELIYHNAKTLQIDPRMLRKFEEQTVIATSEGLNKLVVSEENNKVYRFEPALSIGTSQIENYKQIQIIYAYNKEVAVVKTFSQFGLLRKKMDGNYHWDANALKKVRGITVNRVYLEPKGVIWIGSEVGLYRYDSRVKKNYATPYRALIRDVSVVNDELLFEGTYYDISMKHNGHYPRVSSKQPESLVYRLPYQKNTISFSYSSTFYEHAEFNRYSYRLKGYEPNFSSWTSQQKKEYTNLPEGDYQFEVKAKNIFEHESMSATYEFFILPPWYRTRLAYLSYVGMFFLMMYVGIRFNTRRLIATKKRLEKIIKQRTAQITRQKDLLVIKNKEITQAYASLESTHRKLKSTQNQLLDASWKAGMADVASNVLHNIGNALNSVNISQNLLREGINRTKLPNLGKALEIVNNPVDFKPISDRGRKAADYLSKLNEQLNNEHLTHLKEIQRLGKNVNRVSSILAAQQKYTEASGVKELLTLKELIEMSIEMSLLSEDDKIEVIFDYKYEEAINVERHKVIQVLINLIHNAKRSLEKANQKDRMIKIITRAHEEERVRIEMIDNGEGLEAETLSRIFTFEIDFKGKSQDLDLHASANAAKSIGGSLVAQSDGIGKGSTFILEIPIK